MSAHEFSSVRANALEVSDRFKAHITHFQLILFLRLYLSVALAAHQVVELCRLRLNFHLFTGRFDLLKFLLAIRTCVAALLCPVLDAIKAERVRAAVKNCELLWHNLFETNGTSVSLSLLLCLQTLFVFQDHAS